MSNFQIGNYEPVKFYSHVHNHFALRTLNILLTYFFPLFLNIFVWFRLLIVKLWSKTKIEPKSKIINNQKHTWYIALVKFWIMKIWFTASSQMISYIVIAFASLSFSAIVYIYMNTCTYVCVKYNFYAYKNSRL